MERIKVFDSQQRLMKAGGVVTRKVAGNYEVLLISSDGRDWAFPKGHLEPDETIERAALREVEEETGYTTKIIKDLPSLEYVSRLSGDSVVVHLFQLEVVGGEMKKEFEIDHLAWFPLQDIESVFGRQDLIDYALIIKHLLV